MYKDSKSIYRIQVDEQLLRSLFFHAINEITKQEIRAVEKVAMVVYNKYFRKYSHLKRDLREAVILAVLNRHPNFDPQYRAYNYIYTIARNEMGNFIKKVTKEHLSDDLATLYDRADENDLLQNNDVRIARCLAGEFEGPVMDISEDALYQTLMFIEHFLCTHMRSGNPSSMVAEKMHDCLLEE